MKMTTASYRLVAKYKDQTGEEKEASVELDIDFKKNSFSINPTGTSHAFKFCQSEKTDPKLWIAIAELIKKATKRGEELIKENNKK